MPSRRHSKGARSHRQPVRRPVRGTPRLVEAEPASQDLGDIEPVATSRPSRLAATRPAAAPRAATSSRARSRAPAQIVIANYDFLRHDLRLLGVLAPSLVVVLVVLSFVVH